MLKIKNVLADGKQLIFWCTLHYKHPLHVVLLYFQCVVHAAVEVL